MGYIKHEAVIAVVSDYDSKTVNAIEAFRQGMPEEYRRYLLGPALGVNGYNTYVFTPDGSKEGWGHSDEAAEYRDRFAVIAAGERYEDGSGSATVVKITFGGDYGWEHGLSTQIVSR